MIKAKVHDSNMVRIAQSGRLPFLGSRLAKRLIEDLPVYQVAFWPDGWEVDAHGGVTIRDTHEMAEARRWYRLAERNRSREDACRIMSLHGVYVPRPVVEMAGQAFASECVVSVAVQLVAGDWVKQRRRRLLAHANDAVRIRALSWSGSLHVPGRDGEEIAAIVRNVLSLCVAEGLISPARYRVRVHPDDGYGILAHRCRIEVCFDSYERRRLAAVLRAALVPWNRAVVRNGEPVHLIGVEVQPRSAIDGNGR